MIPSNLWPHTHHDVTRFYHEQYAKDVQAGKYQPILYPWDTLAVLLVIIYMLIPHQNRAWLRKARFFIFAINLMYTAYLIKNVRAKGVANTLGIGLIAAWGTMYILAVIVCNDPQRDFMRIERTEGMFSSDRAPVNGTQNGNARTTSNSEDSNGVLKDLPETKESLGPSRRHGEFAWQAYPSTPFIERLDWVLDLFANFRGANWNWRTISTPPPPKPVQEQLLRNSVLQPKYNFRTHPSQSRTYPTRREMLIGNTKTLVTGYLILDLIKTIASHDPYFWGYIDRAPAPYLPAFLLNSPVLIHALRLVICQFGIKWALESLFALSPLFFSGVLGPAVLGARAEPWIYPSTWGSYALVLDNGLAGWWSGWWHQTFRFAFEQPSRKAIEVLGWNPKGLAARALQLVVAFGLSGALHASGSVTCHGATFPLRGPMQYFLLQAAACFVEGVLRQGLAGSRVTRSMPQWVKRTLTFVYVHVWHYHTAHLLCDDFARGGVWLFEPCPVSLFRGLGFGAEGDGWLAIEALPSWHRGDTWYKTGITF
ncbi:uncharacterized protein CC84DRAFT_1144926 [Paraphaeosphaeria sporulosa]|uniref:Wax synthase domain-containing protein n=1 Tax=Paraphaeosphaeria sporulosa TaxID=1460663 RepID=A0A177CCZ8_9PLEO|nr:uncharacterized protein CC84DRAFT_1144926 [Paraphaeosphaeria sporulosa]OAG05513.1 hypothetical protein CC84DRAFT_1144926 [Paraphaeosphaeria sporulosa]